MFGFSVGEILLIAIIALLLFGNDKLPQNIKKFFKGWNQTKKVAFDLQKSWQEIKYDLQKNVELYDSDIKKVQNLSHTLEVEIKKPVQSIVSQDEIDSYQQAQEAPILK